MAERGGQSGNDNAARGAVYRHALKRALAELADDAGQTPDYEEGLKIIAVKVVAAAAGGDVNAAEKIGDRFDGRPAQSLTLEGNPDKPVSLLLGQIGKSSVPISPDDGA
jgi:hypothetical protein